MVLRTDDEVTAEIVKQYNGREAAVPNTRRKRFILERDCYVDHRKEAVEDFFSWLQEKYGELEIVRIRDTGGKLDKIRKFVVLAKGTSRTCGTSTKARSILTRLVAM